MKIHVNPENRALNFIRLGTIRHLTYIWATSSKKVPSSIRKMCGLTAKFHPGLCYSLKHSVVSIDSVCRQRRPWSDCADALSDQGLCCLHTFKDMFSVHSLSANFMMSQYNDNVVSEYIIIVQIICPLYRTKRNGIFGVIWIEKIWITITTPSPPPKPHNLYGLSSQSDQGLGCPHMLRRSLFLWNDSFGFDVFSHVLSHFREIIRLSFCINHRINPSLTVCLLKFC